MWKLLPINLIYEPALSLFWLIVDVVEFKNNNLVYQQLSILYTYESIEFGAEVFSGENFHPKCQRLA